MRLLKSIGHLLSRILSTILYPFKHPFKFTEALFLWLHGRRRPPSLENTAASAGADERQSQNESTEILEKQVAQLDDLRQRLREYNGVARACANGKCPPYDPQNSTLRPGDYAYLNALRPDEAQKVAELKSRDLLAFKRGDLRVDGVRSLAEIRDSQYGKAAALRSVAEHLAMRIEPPAAQVARLGPGQLEYLQSSRLTDLKLIAGMDQDDLVGFLQHIPGPVAAPRAPQRPQRLQEVGREPNDILEASLPVLRPRRVS